MKSKFSRLALSGALFTLSTSALIPELSYAQLEEVIVTARRMEESLQDTPVAVTAISGDVLEASGSLDLIDVGDMAPNVDFSNGASVSGLSSAPSVFVRGIGQSDFVIVTDPAVGLYVDGIYLGRSIGGLMDLVDLERVEVLRGPQGTLYGRNSIGGAVNFVSRKPDFDGFSATANLTGGQDDHMEFKASANIPISDRVAARVSGMVRNREGYVKALQYDDVYLGNDDVMAVRGQLLIQPSDRLSIELSADYTREKENPAPLVALNIGTLGEPTEVTQFPRTLTQDRRNFNTGGQPPPVGFGLTSGVSTNPACAIHDPDNNIGPPAIADCAGNFYLGGEYGSNSQWTDINGNFFEPTNELDVAGFSANVSWDTDNGTLMYLTGWREFKSDFHQDGDFTPFLIFENHNRQFDNEQFSHELQYTGTFVDDKLDITAGLYTFREEGREIVRIKGEPRTQSFIAMGMGGLISDPPIFFDNIRDIENESSAIYLQAVYHATDRLHLTGGIRRTEDTKKYNLHLDFLGRPDAADAMGTGSEPYDETTPMVSIGYDFSDNVFGYLTWSEGFRDGGFAARFPGGALPNPLPGFQAEFVTSTELGIKSEMFDRRLRANVALFTTDYEDFQTAAAPVGVAPGTVAGTIINIGDVEMFGFEAELMAQVTDNFTWTWNIGYIDTDLVCINTFDANGIPTNCSPSNTASTGGFIIGVDHELPRQPEWNWNMGFVYNQRIDGMMQGAELSWRANWTHTDEMETTLTNIGLTRNPEWDRVDASVTLHPSSGDWSLQLGARNLFDENYTIQRATQSSDVFAVKARPRQLYATYRYNFGGR